MNISGFIKNGYDYAVSRHIGSLSKPSETYFRIAAEKNRRFISFQNKKYEVRSIIDHANPIVINELEDLQKITSFFNRFFNDHASIEMNKGTFQHFTIFQIYGKSKMLEDQFEDLNKNNFNYINNNITDEIEDEKFNNFIDFNDIKIYKNKDENYKFNELNNSINCSEINILDEIEDENYLDGLNGSINLNDEKNPDEIQIHFSQKDPHTKITYPAIHTIKTKNLFGHTHIELKKIKKVPFFPRLTKILKIVKRIFRSIFRTEPLTEKLVNHLNSITRYYSPGIETEMLKEAQNGITVDEQKIFAFLSDIESFVDIPRTGMTKEQILFQILTGAYVIVEDDKYLYESWAKGFEGKTTRHSSHKSAGKQYSIQGKFIGEVLFSYNDVLSEDNSFKSISWFQLERYPTSFLYVVPHLWCFVLYWLTGANQGPHGSSFFTEKNPLILHYKSFSI